MTNYIISFNEPTNVTVFNKTYSLIKFVQQEKVQILSFKVENETILSSWMEWSKQHFLSDLALFSLNFSYPYTLSPLLPPFTAPLSFHRSPLLSPLPWPFTARLSFCCSLLFSPLPSPFTAPLSFHRSPLLSPLPSPFTAPLSFHRSPFLLLLPSLFKDPLSLPRGTLYATFRNFIRYI